MIPYAFQEYNLIQNQINSAYHEAARRMGLSDSELDILYVLSTHEPGCNQSVLYKEAFSIRSTVNSAIRKMEKAGLLYLTPGTGRNTRVYLTDAGQALARDTAERVIRAENEIAARWRPEELELFLRLNRDFAEQLTEKVAQF